MVIDRQRLIARVWTRFKKSGSETLRNLLIEHYLPVVRQHAQRICARLPASVRLDEMLSAGTLGLMDAIDQFDPARKIKFETFCTRRVCGAMTDELRSMDTLSRLVRQRARKLARASEQLAGELGRPPTDEELAARLHISLARFRKQYRGAARAVVLHSISCARDEDDRHPGEVALLADDRVIDPLVETQRRTLRELVTRGLSRAQRLLLLLYYYEGLNMREVGHALSLSESRVCQMHKLIVRNLRSRLSERISDFHAAKAA